MAWRGMAWQAGDCLGGTGTCGEGGEYATTNVRPLPSSRPQAPLFDGDEMTRTDDPRPATTSIQSPRTSCLSSWRSGGRTGAPRVLVSTERVVMCLLLGSCRQQPPMPDIIVIIIIVIIIGALGGHTPPPGRRRASLAAATGTTPRRPASSVLARKPPVLTT